MVVAMETLTYIAEREGMLGRVGIKMGCKNRGSDAETKKVCVGGCCFMEEGDPGPCLMPEEQSGAKEW